MFGLISSNLDTLKVIHLIKKRLLGSFYLDNKGRYYTRWIWTDNFRKKIQIQDKEFINEMDVWNGEVRASWSVTDFIFCTRIHKRKKKEKSLTWERNLTPGAYGLGAYAEVCVPAWVKDINPPMSRALKICPTSQPFLQPSLGSSSLSVLHFPGYIAAYPPPCVCSTEGAWVPSTSRCPQDSRVPAPHAPPCLTLPLAGKAHHAMHYSSQVHAYPLQKECCYDYLFLYHKQVNF